jgi:hypothetical protein
MTASSTAAYAACTPQPYRLDGLGCVHMGHVPYGEMYSSHCWDDYIMEVAMG